MNQGQANSSLGAAIGANMINPFPRAKGASVRQVSNGFIISLEKVDTYGNDDSIAANAEEIASVLKEYFS